jgi:hypothetical protein
MHYLIEIDLDSAIFLEARAAMLHDVLVDLAENILKKGQCWEGTIADPNGEHIGVCTTLEEPDGPPR